MTRCNRDCGGKMAPAHKAPPHAHASIAMAKLLHRELATRRAGCKPVACFIRSGNCKRNVALATGLNNDAASGHLSVTVGATSITHGHRWQRVGNKAMGSSTLQMYRRMVQWRGTVSLL